jgi:hypothetical protein
MSASAAAVFRCRGADRRDGQVGVESRHPRKNVGFPRYSARLGDNLNEGGPSKLLISNVR